MQCRVDFNICLMLKMESAKQVQEDTCTGSGSFTIHEIANTIILASIHKSADNRFTSVVCQ